MVFKVYFRVKRIASYIKCGRRASAEARRGVGSFRRLYGTKSTTANLKGDLKGDSKCHSETCVISLPIQFILQIQGVHKIVQFACESDFSIFRNHTYTGGQCPEKNELAIRIKKVFPQT